MWQNRPAFLPHRTAQTCNRSAAGQHLTSINAMLYHTLLFCDLDGTLISRYRPLSSANAGMIARLHDSGIGVVAASGRSPSLLHAVLAPDLPLAAAICSTGVGIIDWQTQDFLLKRELSPGHVQQAVACLRRRQCNFLVMNPLPGNHAGKYFIGRPDTAGRSDFFRKLQGAADFLRPLSDKEAPGPAAQMLAIFDPDELPLVDEIRQELSGNFSLVRATSPVDQKSIWLECFAPDVNKASAASWLKQHLAPDAECYALGNDYNDCDLLDWADHARVVGNAPDVLQKQYGVLSSEPENILEEAVRCWKLL